MEAAIHRAELHLQRRAALLTFGHHPGSFDAAQIDRPVDPRAAHLDVSAIHSAMYFPKFL